MSRVVSEPSGQHLGGDAPVLERQDVSVAGGLLDEERDFYEHYAWCLNPFPTVQEAVEHLRGEVDRLGAMPEAWQNNEVMTNVFLLACALLNAVDEYLRGKTLRVHPKLAAVPLVRIARWATEKLGAVLRHRRRARARRWRENCQASLNSFLLLFQATQTPDPTALGTAAEQLALSLRLPLPSDLQAELVSFSSAFRRLDLTHGDVLALGRRFTARFPDRLRPLLLVGLRTTGSYFAPLLRAFLQAEGYRTVDAMTLHPEKGPGAAERAELIRCARAGHLAVIVDDPPDTGDPIVLVVEMARKAGFAPGSIAALLPAHPARRDWHKSLFLSDTVLLSLEPEEWHKRQLLERRAIESRLKGYYRGPRFSGVRVVPSSAADQFNAQLQSRSEDVRRARLKRVYEVRLQTAEGEEETRYVLANSVGWGWLGYHAFLAGHRLTGFVPPVLGLRDGILYTEWLPQAPAAKPGGGAGSSGSGRPPLTWPRGPAA